MNKKKLIKLIIAALLVALLVFLGIKGIIRIDGDGKIVPGNNVINVVEPDDGNKNSGSNTNGSGNKNDASNTNGSGNKNESGNTPVDPIKPDEKDDADGQKEYSSKDLKKLTGTEIFNSTAIEHIFMGNVNSSGKGSGYHYDMLTDSPGEIIEGTRSKLDKNNVYTAQVEVDGHKKDGISTFFPDDWTPQEVVDAIAEARQEALKTGKKSGSYYVGHSRGLQINMYLDSNKKVVTAFPVKGK